jgi:hypothetical protein
MDADPTIADPTIADPDGSTLEVEVTEVLGGVQFAFSEVVRAVPGPTSRPHEIGETLGLHKTLAWKLAKLVEARDPVTVYQRLPGRGAVEKVLDAAQRQGVDVPALERVRGALSTLDAFIAEHAGDRDSFEIILAGMSPDGTADRDIMFRKAGFRATSHIWGVDARTLLRTVIVHPGERDRWIDAAVIFGCIELRRLHADRSWLLNRWRPTDDLGRPIPVVREPIDAVANGQAPVLSGFCTEAEPRIQRVVRDELVVEDEILDGPIGRAGVATYVLGEVVRDVMPTYRDEANEMVAQNLEIRTPCRHVVFDHLVPKDLFGRVHPRLRMFGEIAGRPLYWNLRSQRDRLPVPETVEPRGSGVEALSTPEVPRYPEMVEHVCDRLGWDVETFDVYRVHMEYPYVPSMISIDYPLPGEGP